jgi:Uma2 family endonuclease
MALATDRPTQTISLSFEDFLAQHGDDSRYELIDGELFDLEPTGPHEEVAAAIARWLNYDIVQQGADYFIPHRCLIKPLANQTGFRPDVIVLNRAALFSRNTMGQPTRCHSREHHQICGGGRQQQLAN